jgi:hypothetical protein
MGKPALVARESLTLVLTLGILFGKAVHALAGQADP